MSKLISQIQNYPLSDGATAYNNKLLLSDSYAIQQNKLYDYFKQLFELSKNIKFFDETNSNADTWNDLLKQDAIFQLARFLTVKSDELNYFFTQLPQTNFFLSDNKITQKEYEILFFQKNQIIQYLFELHKTIILTISEINQIEKDSIISNNNIAQIFARYESLFGEITITAANKIQVAAFNEINFPIVDKTTIHSLKPFFNPKNVPATKVLNVYSTKLEKIKAANEYAYSIFKSLIYVHQKFSLWANTKLNELVSNTTNLEPHTGLLVAFCKLKMLFDARYNQLIQQSTSFVFEDILQLTKQKKLPDTAYVSAELAKNVKQYFVDKNTLFKAGKNSNGKTVYYKATQSAVFNSAKIEYIKSTVRTSNNNGIAEVYATDDTANPKWQVNNAWLPFNDIETSQTGLAFESILLESVSKKDTSIVFNFHFKNNIPTINNIDSTIPKFNVELILEDESKETLQIENITLEDNVLKIWANIASDLAKAVKKGVNARIMLESPDKDEQFFDYVDLYKYLLSEQIKMVKVSMEQQKFVPGSVRAASVRLDTFDSFIAFGSQSKAGTSFRIAHPFLKFAKETNVSIEWEEKLNTTLDFIINNANYISTLSGEQSSTFSQIHQNNSAYIIFKLNNDITYQQNTKVGSQTVSVTLPKVLQVKSIEIEADLEEDIYIAESLTPIRFILHPNYKFINVKSLYSPFVQKTKQRIGLIRKNKELGGRFIKKELPHNMLAHIYPLGNLTIFDSTHLTFLPDYSKNNFYEYVADLYIGLSNIKQGQSISLLFDIADETAGQSEKEAVISWFYLSDNVFKKINTNNIIDTTSNFLQSGIVQLSLPEDATNDNTIIEGENTFWIIARCDKNYEVVANIRNIKTNALAVQRVLDENNQETKISVAPNTIVNIYPKTANIKAIEQSIASFDGREEETTAQYFWRSSQRLRHKQRSITQWDFEQIILEKFKNIFKVKCLNHAYYNNETNMVIAKPRNTLVVLLPIYKINENKTIFQPAITLSKLTEIKRYLQSKTSAFNQLQIMNTNWDVIKFEIDAVLKEGILDIPHYQEQLDIDLKKFIAPWAFEQSAIYFTNNKIYIATIIDYIDELPYINHISQLRVFKNDIEQIDEITTSGEVHLLTSCGQHTIKLDTYAD